MMDKYFDYRKHKTDFKTEVIAGVSTFLTMAYIMFLNPVILADGGFDFGGVFTATALATALACFIAAFYAKTWPVGLAPGMGINAFIAYGVCLGMNYTPARSAWSCISCWRSVLNNFTNPNKSLAYQFNSKKFKTWNWCRYRSVLSNYWF